jgi:hypothetical protein
MFKLTLSVAILLFGVSATSQQQGIKQLALTKGKSHARSYGKSNAQLKSKLKNKISNTLKNGGLLSECPEPSCVQAGTTTVEVIQQAALEVYTAAIEDGSTPEAAQEETVAFIEEVSESVADVLTPEAAEAIADFTELIAEVEPETTGTVVEAIEAATAETVAVADAEISAAVQEDATIIAEVVADLVPEI